MGRSSCTHNHNTTNLATRLNTIKPSTATLNLEVLSTRPLQWDNLSMDSLSMDLPQQDNLITDSHNMANPNMANPNMVNLSMASLKMDKHLTDSFSPVPIPCLEGNPPQTPGTTHKLG
jgi:hypothetical protein